MRILISLLLLFSFSAHAITEEDLLDPQQAFKFSAQVLNANTIEVRY